MASSKVSSSIDLKLYHSLIVTLNGFCKLYILKKGEIGILVKSIQTMIRLSCNNVKAEKLGHNRFQSG